MKAIMVMFDTLNRRMLPPYGADERIHAPNFARLAERAVTFDNAYVGSMPCMPARRELHTGRYNFLHRGWGQLEAFDDSMPQILREHGVYTHLVTDHFHYYEDGGATYHTRYSSWEFVRGQEGDPWKGEVADPAIPEVVTVRDTHKWRQDWVNRQYMRREQDQPQPNTFDLGLEFIRTNHDQDNWFLQIETFDPHEPFFTQQHYQDLYPHDYDGPHFDWPEYGPVTETPAEVAHLRNQYLALLSMCDRQLGRVLQIMDLYDLWDDTLLIVNTDHGFLLGEHDFWAKNIMPLYNEIAHIPLFIWDPRSGKRGTRNDALVQMIDMAPTLLEYFGVERPPDMQGIPLRETLAQGTPTREAALFGHHGRHVNVTDGRYVYMRGPARDDNMPLYAYTLNTNVAVGFLPADDLRRAQLVPPFAFTKQMPLLKIPTAADAKAQRYALSMGTLLFDVVDDPLQTTPLDDDAAEARMLAHLVALMQANHAPVDQYERLGVDFR